MPLLIFSLLFSFLFADIKSEITKFYKAHYPKIEIISISSNTPLPTHYNHLKILINPKLSNGLIKVDNKYYSIKIKAKIPAYVAMKTIKINEYIAPNVELKKIDFRMFYSPPIYNIKNLVASKIISKNNIITSTNTKPAPAIFKNQPIQVIIKSNNVEIITSATALNNGNIGEYINIKLNGKRIKAKVIKKGVVEVW